MKTFYLYLKPILLFFLLIGTTSIGKAATLYSTGVTDWKWSTTTSWTFNSNGTGNCGCTPTGGDVAIIRSGDSISVPTNINVSGNLTLQIYGVLNITGFLDLNGTSSIVNIYPGGHLSSNGSSSSKLRIGGTSTAEYDGTDGTLYGPWTISNGSSASNGTLPVVLLSFTGTRENSSVLLEWETSQEINSSHFEIQKSSDGHNFTTIGEIKASGSSSIKHFYSFEDRLNTFGEKYYRLAQVDLDKNISFSSIIEVNLNDSFDFTVYPNPSVGNDFEIQLGISSSNTLVILQDIHGQEIFSKVIITNEQSYIAGKDIQAALTPGMYFVIASSDKKYINKKLIIQ